MTTYKEDLAVGGKGARWDAERLGSYGKGDFEYATTELYQRAATLAQLIQRLVDGFNNLGNQQLPMTGTFWGGFGIEWIDEFREINSLKRPPSKDNFNLVVYYVRGNIARSQTIGFVEGDWAVIEVESNGSVKVLIKKPNLPLITHSRDNLMLLPKEVGLYAEHLLFDAQQVVKNIHRLSTSYNPLRNETSFFQAPFIVKDLRGYLDRVKQGLQAQSSTT